jgi:hypothetical protein
LINNDDIIASEFEAVNLKHRGWRTSSILKQFLKFILRRYAKDVQVIRQASQSFCDFREQNILSESFVFL